jgi:hypothetical protein
LLFCRITLALAAYYDCCWLTEAICATASLPAWAVSLVALISVLSSA